MSRHTITDWWTSEKAEGTYINGYVDGFGVMFLIKSIDEEANTATSICGTIYDIYRKDMYRARPIKIDSTGTYKTRIGHTVEIFDIKDNGATFNCHGYRYVPNPKRKCGYDLAWNIWAPTGKFVAVGETDYDIVEKL